MQLWCHDSESRKKPLSKCFTTLHTEIGKTMSYKPLHSGKVNMLQFTYNCHRLTSYHKIQIAMSYNIDKKKADTTEWHMTGHKSQKSYNQIVVS